MVKQNFIASLTLENSKNILQKEMLSLEKLELIHNSCAQVNNLKLLYEIPLALRNNFHQFQAFVSHKYEANNAFDVNVINNMNVEANRLIFNLLASLPIVQEYYKNKLLQNRYEQEFEPKLQQFHLNSLEYAFLYCLRNYSTHYFVPVSRIDFAFKKESEINLQLYIDKSSLLEKKSYWNDKILKRLNAVPEKIDIVNMILKGVPDFLEFLSTYLKEYYVDIEDSFKLFRDLNSKYNPNHRTDIKICTSRDPSFKTMSLLSPCTFVDKFDKVFLKNNIYL